MGQVRALWRWANLYGPGACPVEAGKLKRARCVPCGGEPTFKGQGVCLLGGSSLWAKVRTRKAGTLCGAAQERVVALS